MNDISTFFVDTASIETLQGAGAYGDVFAAPVTNAGFLEDAIKLVRNASGEQVVSSSTWYTDVANAALYTPDSRFTSGSVVARVITVNVNDSGPLGLPDHVAVSLT